MNRARIIIAIAVFLLALATAYQAWITATAGDGGRVETSNLSVYVFPGFNQDSGWPASDHWHVVWVSVPEPITLIVDADLNGLGGGDAIVAASPGQATTIGFSDAWSPSLTYDNPVLAVYSRKPISAYYVWQTNDYGIYDERYALIGAPPASTRLIGYGKDFYITCVTPGCRTEVRVNGKPEGEVQYGETLEVHYDNWVPVLIEADEPIVAVMLTYDSGSRDKVAGAPAVPPQPGRYWIPPSLKRYYGHLGAESIEEKCLVFDQEAKLIRTIDMGKPVLFNFDMPVAIFCYRKVVHRDPWAGVHRTIVSYFPVYSDKATNNTVEVGRARPYGAHGGSAVVFVGAYSDTLIGIDYEPYGSVDEWKTVKQGEYAVFSPDNMNGPARIIVKGHAYFDNLGIAAWSGHIDALLERANTMSALPGATLAEATTTTTSKPPAGVPVYNGLVAYYSFDNCSLVDMSGNGHGLKVLHGGFACIPGPRGEAAYFDGSTALASDEFPWPSDSFTIAYMMRVDKPYENTRGALWITPLTRGRDSPVVDCFTLAFRVKEYNASFVLGLPYVRITDNQGYRFGNNLNDAGLIAFRRGSWVFVALSYDAGSGVLRLYIDGRKVYEGSVGHYPVIRHPMPLLLGYDPFGDVEYLIGGLDEVLVYSRPLSDEEIQALYQWLASKSSRAVTVTVTAPVQATVTRTSMVTVTRTVEKTVTSIAPAEAGTVTVTSYVASTRTLTSTITKTVAAAAPAAVTRMDVYFAVMVIAAAVIVAGLLAGRKQ